MNLAEARAEATNRWVAHGGWARELDAYHRGKKATRYQVGVFDSAHGGAQRVILGNTIRDFDTAFDQAERALERKLQPKPKPKPKGLLEQLEAPL